MATSNPIFIGITGGSCSGKTTFCSALEKELAPLSPIVFHMDDYYLPPEERPHMTGFADGKDYIDDNSPASFQLDALRQELDDALQMAGRPDFKRQPSFRNRNGNDLRTDFSLGQTERSFP